MSDEALETFIADYISAQDNPTVFFVWQGGEPTLAGLEYYRRVVEVQRKAIGDWRSEIGDAKSRIPERKIANALQTNGVLLDEEWCRFLAANRWAVGLSLDGPADIHDFTAGRRAAGGHLPRFAWRPTC